MCSTGASVNTVIHPMFWSDNQGLGNFSWSDKMSDACHGRVGHISLSVGHCPMSDRYFKAWYHVMLTKWVVDLEFPYVAVNFVEHNKTADLLLD